MATLFIDFENGDDNYAGTSFDLLASGTNGRITGSIFSSSTANFPNNGTLCNTKNLLPFSENLDNDNYWNVVRVTRTRSNISPPSGVSSSSVWNILETTDNNTHDLRTTAITVNLTLGINYTTSFYVKANGRNQIVVRHGASSAKAIRYNISTGVVAQSGASATGSISNEGDGWYRISLTTTPDASNDLIYITPAQDSHTGTTIESYTGDPTKGFYISAPQLEQANSVTLYETPVPSQYLSIFNGTIYAVYQILAWISSTSLTIGILSGGTALANQSVDRQYFIGGRWRTLTNGATAVRTIPGDEIRVMSSPDPTFVGNATFTSNKADTVRTISSSTNATPISITSANHGYSTGDTVVITGHTVNTNANGTWEITVTGTNTFTLDNSTGNGTGATTGNVRRITNAVVRLNSSVTQNIASFGNRGSGRTAWVQSANVTVALDITDTKEGDVSDSIAIAAAFTTGKAAYKTISTLDLSGYQQISFYIKQTAGTTIVAGDISLRLCSDTIGNVTVNTINIPGIGANLRFLPITVDLNTNLGNSIQSVALYVDTDRGAQTFLISNIIACKARSSNDSLNLQSLIGKNTVSEPWWATIQSINGTRVVLDQGTNVTPLVAAVSTGASFRGYSGVSETTNLYKRETIKTTIATISTATVQTLNEGGASNSSIMNVRFGYDRTNMSSITGQTFLDGLNGFGYGIVSSRSFANITNLGVVRYTWGLYFLTSNNSSASNIWAVGNSTYGIYWLTVNRFSALNLVISFNADLGLFMNSICQKIIITNAMLLSNGSSGFQNSISSNNTITNSVADNNNAGFVIDGGFNNLFDNCISTNHTSVGISYAGVTSNNTSLGCTTSNNAQTVTGTTQGINYIKNCILNEIIPVVNFATQSNGKVIFINNNSTTNNYIHYTEGGTIFNSVAVRYSNSGFAWALAPTSSTARDANFPLDLPIAKVAVNANSAVTVRAWMRRSNTALTTGLRIKGGQISGVPTDITSYMTADADIWQQVVLSFTPTEIGVVEILAECYGGSTFTGYVDDISITQV